MYKQIILRAIASILLLALTCGCTRDSFTRTSQESNLFSIEEAKSIFTEQVGDGATKASLTKKRSALNCGDFAPVWEEAEFTQDGDKVVWEVPIESEYAIYSYRKIAGQKIQRPWRRVSQTLLVRKDLVTGETEALMKSKVKRHGLPAVAKFSGIEVYTKVESNKVVKVCLIDNDATAEVADIHSEGKTFLTKCKEVGNLLKGYSFFKSKNIRTKDDYGGEPDPYGDDDGDGDDDPFGLIHWEDNLYYDPLTNEVGVDTDGDGRPDISLDEYLEDKLFEDMLNADLDEFFSSVVLPDGPEVNPGGDSNDDEVIRGAIHSGSNTDIVYAVANIPTYSDAIEFNVPNASVLSALSYESSIVGSAQTQTFFLTKYAALSGYNNGAASGLHPVYASSLPQTYFNCANITTRSGIVSSINNGKIVFSFFLENNDMKAITIIGYNQTDGSFVYVDAESGVCYDEDPDNLIPIRIPSFAIYSVK